MSTSGATFNPSGMVPEQVELLTRTIAKGATPDELQMFLYICNRTGLDPFARQIHAVKRWDSSQQREVMSVQTGIDGYRLIAERTGKYMPGKEAVFTYNAEGQLLTATSTVEKLGPDDVWKEITATAHFGEYAQKKRDGSLTRFWSQMPHVMLAKVSEALALRRAFPMELSGVYTEVEMDDTEPADAAAVDEPKRLASPDADTRTITEPQAKMVYARSKNAGHTVESIKAWLLKDYGIEHLRDIRRADFDAVIARVDNPLPLLAEDDTKPAATEREPGQDG